MKIEKGMYVRTKHGTIDKIKFVSEVMCGLDETLSLSLEKETEDVLKKDILKASYDLIDLIEVGDYVNERFVNKYNGELGIFEILESNWKFEKIEDVIKDYGELWIVTHEQFDSMKYEVK